MLALERQWYDEHQDALLPEYRGQFLVIKDQRVIGTFANALDAYLAMAKRYRPGTFLIQYCASAEVAGSDILCYPAAR